MRLGLRNEQQKEAPGVTHLYVHAGNQNQVQAIEFYRDEVLPQVRCERTRTAMR